MEYLALITCQMKHANDTHHYDVIKNEKRYPQKTFNIVDIGNFFLSPVVNVNVKSEAHVHVRIQTQEIIGLV